MAFISGNPDVFFAPGEIDGVEVFRTGAELIEAGTGTHPAAVETPAVKHLNEAEIRITAALNRIRAIDASLASMLDPQHERLLRDEREYLQEDMLVAHDVISAAGFPVRFPV